ncbi:MAG: Grx4 family monothiol glutaredoxin [Pseudomonadota bacterium]|nr:Grx4 family monothiol glutaredoxin [Pseudomonadota bacterium]
MNETVKKRIDDMLEKSPVFVFMKGTPDFPMCGFSARAIGALKASNAQFETFNVLEDEEIREGVKHYANFPTIPQIYIKKQLVGGSDIIMELYESGELQEMVKTSTGQ